jgi:arylsulfatase A-like enzyme
MNATPPRCLLAAVASLFLAVGPAHAADAPPSPDRRPNVLVILADDLGWGDLSCYGNRTVSTPQLDRLAGEGLRFTQYYAAAPICSASRCGILTGQDPGRWRITGYLQTRAGNRECGQADFLDPRAPTLPRTFRAAGYATAHLGKWHLGGGRDVVDAPRFAAYGYDLGLGTYESPEPAAPLGRETMPWEKRLEPGQVPRHERTRWMVDQVLAFLDAHRDRPCFVNLWLDDVHTPFRPSADQRAAVSSDAADPVRAAFGAVLAETDRQLGRLLAGLRERGIEGQTLVLFAGDNGPEPSFDHARTGGLRGMKWSLYEGGIRVPLIARWPGVLPAGRVDETSVIGAVDLFPTLCALCGIDPPPGASLDGQDRSAVLRGTPSIRGEPLFWQYGRKPGSESGEARGLLGFPYPKEPGARSPNLAVREGPWKLLVNDDGNGAELYNLVDDPHEAHDRAADDPERARRLAARVLGWRRTLP